MISQSGSLTGALLSRGQARGIAYSTLVSVGNEASTCVGQIGNILMDDDQTDGFLLFLETIRNPQALSDFARAAHLAGKPIIAYLVGRSEQGQALAVSHTGAMTGAAAAAVAWLQSIGIHLVQQFDALFEAPAVLRLHTRLAQRTRHVTVVSTTGGGGAMVIDQLSLRGVVIAGASEQSQQFLVANNITPGHSGLIDVTLAGTRYEVMKSVVLQLIKDPKTGVLLVVIGSSAQFNPELAVTPIIDAVAESGADAAPVVAFALPHAPESISLLESGGVPSFRTLESCTEAVALLLQARAPVPPVKSVVPSCVSELIDRAPAGVLNEITSASIFSALGIDAPRQLILSADGDLPDHFDLQFPVVAKLVSVDLPHKTDAGAIATNLKDMTALQQAIASMRARVVKDSPGIKIDGVLVQQMVSGTAEALIGLTRDPLVGAVVTVAAGGVMTEIYKDRCIRPAPVSVETAHEMIAEVAGFALLRGYRGRPSGDINALARAVVAVSTLATVDVIEEAEINPLLVRSEGQGVVLLDALIRKRVSV